MRNPLDRRVTLKLFARAGDPPGEGLDRRFIEELLERDIDVEPELYKHHLLKELRPEFKPLLDVRKCGIGERLVFEPYTREVFERTHRWMVNWGMFPKEQLGTTNFESAVVS